VNHNEESQRASNNSMRDFITSETNEILFAQVFLRRHPEIDWYPFGSAANFSLLYLLDRILHEQDISSVLELGAGQTSLLLNKYQKLKNIDVTTLEHDSWWCDRIQQQVNYPLTLAYLTNIKYKGLEIATYDWSAPTDKSFDLILIDGPPGAGYPHFARIGALKFLQNLKEQFIIIMDDAEREGERSTIEELRESLKGYRFWETHVIARKHQWLCGTHDYIPVAYY
jgi:predicted O-methyltransferase YrrM